MKTKRLFAGILTAVLCLSFTAGCTSQGSSENKEKSQSSVGSEQNSKTGEDSKAPDKAEESSQSSETGTEEKVSDELHTFLSVMRAKTAK